MDHVDIYPLGECAATVRFIEKGGGTSWIRQLNQLLQENPVPGMCETVPAMDTLTVYFDPIAVRRTEKTAKTETTFEQVKRALLARMAILDGKTAESGPVIEIPVVYGGEFGPDLAFAASHCGMSEAELIRRHVQPTYAVQMIGFSPGFPYLKGMDPAIAVPRKAVPNPHVPAGSVGIAGVQTGIYSTDSPGGWQIIGRTPLPLFTPERANPVLLRAGDRIRFVPIQAEQYEKAAATAH